MILEGQCALFKTIKYKDMFGNDIKKVQKIIDMERGDIFGEAMICF